MEDSIETLKSLQTHPTKKSRHPKSKSNNIESILNKTFFFFTICLGKMKRKIFLDVFILSASYLIIGVVWGGAYVTSVEYLLTRMWVRWLKRCREEESPLHLYGVRGHPKYCVNWIDSIVRSVSRAWIRGQVTVQVINPDRLFVAVSTRSHYYLLNFKDISK